MCAYRLPPRHIYHAYYRFYFFIVPSALKSTWSRERLIAEIGAGGVPCFVGSCSEMYREKAFQAANLSPATRQPIAHELGETSVALLVHPTLREQDMQRACEVLRVVLLRATR